MALLDGNTTAITEHCTLLLIVHRRHGGVVHLFQVPLLGEALDVEMERVVNLLVEKHTARISPAP